MTETVVRMRLYCQGLGDCNLIGLPRKLRPGDWPDEDPRFWILIDCGIHGAAQRGAERMRAVVADIRAITPRLDVIVVTHEHQDHISGFVQAAEQFESFEIGEIWFSWAEDPKDPDAQRFDRYKSDTARTLAAASMAMYRVPGMSALGGEVDSMLGFLFSAKGDQVRAARERVRKMGDVRHLKPGEIAPLPDEVSGVRAYVLGPPRDKALLGIENSATDTYGPGHGGHGGHTVAAPFENALNVNAETLRVKDDAGAPFDDDEGALLSNLARGVWDKVDPALADFAWNYYFSPRKNRRSQGWRRIDGDWLASGAQMALQLDSRTNNSSLVLAFELVDSGKVLLFAADAQVGNWKSWADVRFPPRNIGGAEVTGAELIARTVFYKVGHHGSGNATLSDEGLERMDGSQLTAFNPTDKSLAGRVRWKDFPSSKLTRRLYERTANRYIQGDDPWLRDPAQVAGVPKTGSLRDLRHDVLRLDVDLVVPWVELDIG